MEIALLRTIPIGAAIEMSINVDGGATWIRVLRKTGANQTFSGPADPSSRAVDSAIRSSTQTQLLSSLIDCASIEDGETYTYIAYSYRQPDWLASAPRSITVAPTADSAGADPLDFIVRRFEAGLKMEVAAGRIKPKEGRIPIYTAPPQAETTLMPVVTVHLDIDQSAERAIGEHIAPDRYDNPDAPDAISQNDFWEEGEGWLSRWTCSVVGWSLNPDERNALRKAIKRIAIGNLPIFEAEGMIQVELTMRDSEDFTTYSVPMYLTSGTLTCLAPALLTGRAAVIDAVEAEAIPTEKP